MTDMTGKRVLVTGATAGIGLETARALAGQGAHVVIVGRNAEKTKAVAEELRAGGRQVDFLLADLSLMAEVRRVAAESLARWDRFDVLVNNAGAIEVRSTCAAR